MQKRPNPGFTIVELLIVIVVIAILAAISIVAYNGIQERARVSSVSAALSQAHKKLVAYQVDFPDVFPADKTAIENIGIKDSETVSYQYSRTAGSPDSYCLTATTGPTSYKISSTAPSPAPGGCAGHGTGGVAAITNLVTNPSAETNTTGMTGLFGAGGAGTASRLSGSGQSGPNYFRVTWSTPPTSMTSSGLWISSNASTPNAAGKTYTASGYLRASWAGGTFNLNLVPYSSTWTYTGGEVYGSPITLSANTWTRFTATLTAPAGTDNMTVRLRAAGGTLPPVNASLDADAFMLTEGTSAPSYADGNSTNWVWNGTPNNSTSTGP